MSPIEQVTPALPGNTVRRPEGRNKRSVTDSTRERPRRDGNRPEQKHDQRPGGSEHIVDELA
jgi:hypothetical protein